MASSFFGGGGDASAEEEQEKESEMLLSVEDSEHTQYYRIPLSNQADLPLSHFSMSSFIHSVRQSVSAKSRRRKNC